MNWRIAAFCRTHYLYLRLPNWFALPILLAALLLESRATAQALTNGGFELPGEVPSGGYILLSSGDTRLAGWTVGGTGAYIGLINGLLPDGGVDFPAKDGTYHVTFNGGDNPAGMFISQTFDTVVGEAYAVTFYVGRCGSGWGTVRLLATVRSEGGETLKTRVATPPSHGYGTQQRVTFIATTARTTLEFMDTSPDTAAVDLALDAVTIAPAVETTIEVSEVAVCWLGSTNHLYQVQYRSEITAAGWTNLGEPVRGIGDQMCVHEPVLGQERRFYQVVRLP